MIVLQSDKFRFLVLCSLLVYRTVSFTIIEGGSDIGQTQEAPAESGDNVQPINLECKLDLRLGEQWTQCSWVHKFPDIWAYDEKEGFVMCTAAHEGEDTEVCDDHGNIVDPRHNGGINDPTQNPYTAYDTGRLQHSLTETSCGLTINSPHTNDTGIWTCHVNYNNPSAKPLWSQVDLFVANQSVVSLTNPDLFNNPGMSLEVDLSSTSRVEIDAECTAQHGLPPPEIIWYIDEPTNMVDHDVEQSIQGNEVIPTVVSNIRLTLDQNSMSRYGIRATNNYFSFALGCYPNQGDYFEPMPQDYNNPAEVLVFGTSEGSFITAPIVQITFICLSLTLL